MGDNFFFLADCFDKYMKRVLPQLAYPDVSDDDLAKCIKIIKELREDSEMDKLVKDFFREQWCNFLNKFLSDYWETFLETIKNQLDLTRAHQKYIFRFAKTIDGLISKWSYNIFTNNLFDDSADGAVAMKKFVEGLEKDLYTALIADMPVEFSYCLLNTFIFSFEVFNNLYVTRHEQTFGQLLLERHELCKSSQADLDSCFCQTMKKGFFDFRNSLRRAGLFDLLCADVIKSVLYTCIEKYIVKLCEDEYADVNGLAETNLFVKKNLTYWVKVIFTYNIEELDDEAKRILNDSIYCDEFSDSFTQIYGEHPEVFKTFKSIYLYLNAPHNIEKYIINTYVYCRMQKLFEIIINYPGTEKIILDLNQCIQFDPLYRKKFISSLKSSFETRLLHPGVSTCDIIESYATSINAFRLLDPQGIILQIVCDPVRSYLLNREDTIRSIIKILIGSNEQEKSFSDEDPDEEDEFSQDKWKKWDPNPIGINDYNKAMVNSDAISMLISIFDSKDLFVQEYQKMVAHRLLSNYEINLPFEYRSFEILSLRFGENDLQNCQVMLQDLKDSERTYELITLEEKDTLKFQMEPLIISEQFWPENLGFSFPCEQMKLLKLPKEVEESFKCFTNAFEKYKANRTLQWLHHLGLVKFDIHFDNGQTVEFKVRPIQAVIIHHFQEKPVWEVAELAHTLDIPPSLVRQNIKYWQNVGLLTDSEEDRFHLDEEGYLNGSRKNLATDVRSLGKFEEELVDNTATEAVENDPRLELHWNYIEGMLRNLTSLSLDRVFMMLKMFHLSSASIQALTMSELKQFLDRKVFEGELTFINGQYNIKPKV